MTNKTPLAPGSIIGVLGGGQLGRMLSAAATRLGYLTHIYEPLPDCPASENSAFTTTASYDDESAIARFAQAVDICTYEFENIPTQALDIITQSTAILPNRAALTLSQDRLVEKQALNELDLETAPFTSVENITELEQALATIGYPAILKTRRFGYDGKGQVRITSSSGLTKAHELIENTPCILEGFIEFSCEISVIAARSITGETVCYDPGENIHKDGILDTTTVPSSVSQSQLMDAVLLAGKILNAIDYVGVMGVELFATSAGLIVNEVAPRVHNSGHWTQNGCAVDQFEQHIRAITGLPLGNGQRYANVTMTNLIGDEINHISNLLENSDISVHLYGKKEAKAGRKMGHYNQVTPLG